MIDHATAGIAQNRLRLRPWHERNLFGLCVAGDEILQCDDSEADQHLDREARNKAGLRSIPIDLPSDAGEGP